MSLTEKTALKLCDKIDSFMQSQVSNSALILDLNNKLDKLFGINKKPNKTDDKEERYQRYCERMDKLKLKRLLKKQMSQSK